MSLEEEMKREIRRLENQILTLDLEIDKINHKVAELTRIRLKKETDVRILKSNFYPEEMQKETQSTLIGLVKKENI